MSDPLFGYITPDSFPPNGGYVPGQHPIPWGIPAGPAYGSYYPVPPPPAHPPMYHLPPHPGPPPSWAAYPQPPPIPCPPPPPPPQAPTGPPPNTRIPAHSNLSGSILGLPNGTGYLFPPSDTATTLHVFKPGQRPWENETTDAAFIALTTHDRMKVNDLIKSLERQFGIAPASSGNKVRVTELGQLGGGKWQTRVGVVRDGAGSGKTLKAVGWGGAGRNGVPAVWLGVELV